MVRILEGGTPRDAATPVVAGKMEALVAQGPGEADDIGGEVVDAIRRDRFGLVGEVVAALVGDDHAVARLREDAHRAAPRVPELGESVEEDHRRSRCGTGEDDVQCDVADVDTARLEVDAELSTGGGDRVAVGLVSRAMPQESGGGESRNEYSNDP